MSERLAQSQCTGFVLASLGFVTFGFTGAYGFVLNVESLSNPKRRHSIAFDILAVLERPEIMERSP